ncbi:hypothetical protein DL98DRAFT_534467 [Cadophora sp. DSE1049]|nr:hypothetical protein DL98DRAFT_534467 [Cadophora sp. DSE1049]
MSASAAIFYTTNVTIATFFARPTRFANHWRSEGEQEAIDFAHRWEINYQNPPAQKITLPSGQHVTFGGGRLVESELRQANAFCNHLTEIRHLRDSDYDTGTEVAVPQVSKWYLCTRGMRLRTLAIQKALWRGEHVDGFVRLFILEMAARRADGTERLRARMALCNARIDMVLYRRILSTLRKVEEMLLEEALEGWDWRVGLRAQFDARDRLYYEEIGNLSSVAEEKLPACFSPLKD